MYCFLDLATRVISGCPCAAVTHLELGQEPFKNEEDRKKWKTLIYHIENWVLCSRFINIALLSNSLVYLPTFTNAFLYICKPIECLQNKTEVPHVFLKHSNRFAFSFNKKQTRKNKNTKPKQNNKKTPKNNNRNKKKLKNQQQQRKNKTSHFNHYSIFTSFARW